ncbi:LOW QUALITY PROTEIN: uncharacterized protein WCC33_006046 [Rhinophrynus dorsalis]
MADFQSAHSSEAQIPASGSREVQPDLHTVYPNAEQVSKLIEMSMHSALQKLSSSLADSFAMALKGPGLPESLTKISSAILPNENPGPSSILSKHSDTSSNPAEATAQGGGKCTQKRRHTATDSPVRVNTISMAVEQCGLVPHTRSSPPEDTKGGEQNLRRLPPVNKNLRRLKPDSYCSSSPEESSDEDWVPSDVEEYNSDESPSKKHRSCSTEPSEALSTSSTPLILDARGDPMFDPEGIKHPRSSDWTPRPHVAQYLETWVRKPISRSTRSKLRAECPRPIIANKVCETPELDSKMVQFIAKSGKDPRRGVDQALKSCQDKLLDSLGPLTKIFELSEEALQTKSPVDIQVLRGWIQRAICMIGNANSAIASERRRALLLRIDPKLAELANSEPGPSAKGLLFGDTFIKDLGKFVASFTALDKAQTSLRKVFRPHIFDKAGRGRGRSPGDSPRQSLEARDLFSRPVADSGGRDLEEDFPEDVPFPVSISPHFLSSPVRVGGRLAHFFHHWCGLTADPWILQTVKGFQIEFFTTPCQHVLPRPIHFSKVDAALVDNEFSALRKKGAITRSTDTPVGFISNIFLVRKKDSGLRPVINLRTLNECVLYRHFKMEGIHLLRDLLLPMDWMVKIDLQDAYLTVPMAQSSQIYLRFLWRTEIWQFTCLPFGLSSAPWCFTKLLKPVVAYLRSRGFRLIIYLDDMLLMSQDPNILLDQTSCAIRLLSNLGFLVNWKKSQLIPSQRMEFLGFIVDSREASLSLPRAKIKTIRKEIRILRQDRFSLRLLARVVGLLASSIQAIFPGPLHYRALQRLKALHLRRGLGYADVIALSSDAREELLWWLKHLDAWNGKAIFGVTPDLVIESDASLLGWGARMGDISSGGKWSPAEASLHINCLELLAGSFALKSLAKDRVHCCVLLKMDNISAVRYINKLGGTKSKPLAELAKEFWHFCLDRDISIVAEHLPGLSNAVADWNSRHLTDHSDWMLHPSVFTTLHQLASGSGSASDGCLPPNLVSGGKLCVSSICNDPSDHLDNTSTNGDDGGGDTFLANAALVSTTSGIIRGFPSSSAGLPSSSIRSVRLPARPVGIRGPSTHCLVPIRENASNDGFSESAQTLLAESWAPGTRSMYRSAWSTWSRWCLERDLDPVSASPVNVINFLSTLFDSGRAYRTINSYRSAISAGHIPVDGVPVGQLMIVCRLMKGIRLSRPPQSRYQSLWNVNDVLHFLESWPSNNQLSLKQLSAKLTMLLCLISFKRVSDVRALDFQSRSFTPEGVQFRVSRRTKTAIRVVSYPAFPFQPQLCVVNCLKEYELRTNNLRSPSLSQLLISFRSPHLPVSAATLARWIRWIMQLAGVNVALFGAHSTRGAMASKAVQTGGRLEDILRAADWSRESTFRDFYHKPIDHVTHSVISHM